VLPEADRVLVFFMVSEVVQPEVAKPSPSLEALAVADRVATSLGYLRPVALECQGKAATEETAL
jgi:hypothetical protein